MTKLTLISFPTCPFVQRAIIALKEKKVPFDVTYIELDNKPDWFLKISPLGKVPLLKVEREGQKEAVIFESAVILEYLEETAPGAKLHPADPVERAVHRGWMEFGSTVLGDYAKLTMDKDAGNLDVATNTLTQKLARLEETIVGPLFAGEHFSNVDAVFAPIFVRIEALETATPGRLLKDFPKLSAWSKVLRARPSVKESAPENLTELYLARLRKMGSAVLAKAA